MTTTQSPAVQGAANNFDGLLGEIDTLLKAATAEPGSAGGKPGGAKRIRRAAQNADGTGEGTADGDGDGTGDSTLDPDNLDPDGANGEGEPFGKSFEVELPDGTKTEAYDGTAMLKALHAENGALRAEIGGAHKALGATLGVIKALQGQIAQQGDLMKALTADVKALGSQGSGRRAILSVHDKPATTAGAPATSTARPGDVMAKAMALFAEGKMEGGDLRRIEAHQGRGLLAPADVLSRYPGLTS